MNKNDKLLSLPSGNYIIYYLYYMKINVFLLEWLDPFLIKKIDLIIPIVYTTGPIRCCTSDALLVDV